MADDALDAATKLHSDHDAARRQAWNSLRTATLATSSGILVLSFLLLGIEDVGADPLLIAVWAALGLAVIIDLIGLVLDYWHSAYRASTSGTLHHIVVRHVIESKLPIKSKEWTDELEKKIYDLGPKKSTQERWAKFLGTTIDVLAHAAVLSLASGVVLLISFGICNL